MARRTNVKVQMNDVALQKAVASASQEGFEAGAKFLQEKVKDRLQAIEGSTKWKKPGGYGYWREGMEHGFLASKFKVRSFSKSRNDGGPGALLESSQLIQPIEHGSKGRRWTGKMATSKSKKRPLVKAQLRKNRGEIINLVTGRAKTNLERVR